MWLVDYDLPKKPAYNRVKFHRYLKKVLEKLNGEHIKYSSMSVVITTSRELAEEIHELAKKFNATRTGVYEINGNWKEITKYER